MSALSPVRAETALSGRHFGDTMLALRSTICRSSAQQTILALARQLDAAAASRDETDLAYVEAVAAALDCNADEGFVAEVQRRLTLAEQDALRDAWTGCARHESPLERPMPDVWAEKEDAAQRLIETIEGVGAPT